MNIITRITRWYRSKFRGVVYAEDSVPAEGENEYKVVLDLTPQQLEYIKKAREKHGN